MFTCGKEHEEILNAKGLKPIGKIVEGLNLEILKENKKVNYTESGWDSFD